MPYTLVDGKIRPFKLGDLNKESTWKGLEGKKLKFRKFLSFSVEESDLKYITKDEATKLWQSQGRAGTWETKGESAWDDQTNTHKTRDTGLEVTILQDTKARKIDKFNDFKNGQREALFPVGTDFEVKKYRENQNEWPNLKHVLELQEIVESVQRAGPAEPE